jgi:hypothetical protein
MGSYLVCGFVSFLIGWCTGVIMDHKVHLKSEIDNRKMRRRMIQSGLQLEREDASYMEDWGIPCPQDEEYKDLQRKNRQITEKLIKEELDEYKGDLL